MEQQNAVRLTDLIKTLNFETLYLPENVEDILVYSNDVNRPGLQLAGFFDYFDRNRMQIMGKVEFSYLEGMTSEQRREAIDRLFEFKFPALIITRGLEPYPEILENAEKFKLPVLRTHAHTSELITELIPYLNTYLGQRITRHGVLVELYGEGILLTGESGVGKSETAMELIKRGHRLIADDAVEIVKISADRLTGTAPDLIRHFIELRGIGVVNVRHIFGIGAVKDISNIDMVINLEAWDRSKTYDRLGMDTEYMDIMDVKLPCLTIPVKPGRNLAIIIETAAMNNRQKRMGYNAAEDLNERLQNLSKE